MDGGAHLYECPVEGSVLATPVTLNEMCIVYSKYPLDLVCSCVNKI